MRKRHADGSARCSTAPASKSNAGFAICRPRSPHAAGAGPLHVTICAEYDCLLAIGHACGHNVIAAMAAGAGIALAKVANDAGLTVTVLGTPAEEICNAGGKILLLERGEFAGTHFAMMAHPAPVDMAVPPFLPVRGQVHRQGGARFGVSRARNKRGRRAGDRAELDWPAAPAYSSHRPNPRNRHTAAKRQTSCPHTPPRATWCGPAPSVSCKRSVRACSNVSKQIRLISVRS